MGSAPSRLSFRTISRRRRGNGSGSSNGAGSGSSNGAGSSSRRLQVDGGDGSSGAGSSSRRLQGDGGGGGSNDASAEPPSPSQYASELQACEEACRSDPDLQRFGSALEERTHGAIAAVQSDAAASAAVSLRSLRSVAAALLLTDYDAVELILKCPENLRADRDLAGLVVDYIDSSIATLDFCVELTSCLRRARDQQLLLRLALNCFSDGVNDPGLYEKALEELGRFRDAGDPFTLDFLGKFDAVRRQQRALLEKLQLRRKKLDKKLRNVKAWRRISTVIFVSAFSAVLICSVVAAAMTAPPLVTALASAGTAAMVPIGSWFNSLWKGVVDRLEEEREVVGMMERGTEVTVEELRSIGALVARLQGEIEGELSSAAFASRGEEAVKVAVEDIVKRMDEFMKCIEDLEKQVQKCSDFIVKARNAVVKKITTQGT